MDVLDPATVSDELARSVRALSEQHGKIALLTFPMRRDAQEYLKSENNTTWEPYGLRSRAGVEWYMLRPASQTEKRAPSATQPAKAARTGAPTAKSLCLSVYVEGMQRDDFVAAATALGVKEVTAKTMFSDIRAGRIK